jgi:hypothetical protein
MSDVLNSLNPHLICEIEEEVKNHTKEIGRLEKMLLTFDSVSFTLDRTPRIEPTRSQCRK